MANRHAHFIFELLKSGSHSINYKAATTLAIFCALPLCRWVAACSKGFIFLVTVTTSSRLSFQVDG